MRPAFLILLLAAGTLVPIGAASPALLGTEQSPELADPPGNVNYSPFYVGQHDRDHVDLLAGWFEYDAENDSLVFTLKVGSLERANQSTQGGWDVRYSFTGTVSHDDQPGPKLSYLAHKNNQDGKWSAAAFVQKNGGSPIDAPLSFHQEDRTPGYFRWHVPLPYLRNYGDAVKTFHASATEEQFVGQSFVSTNVFNSNSADAASSFVWKDLRPSPANGTEGALASSTAETLTATAPADETATLGVAATTAALLLGVALARFRL